MSEVSVNNTDAAPVAQPNLNIQDIVGLLNIVDIASRRGAFRAEELSSVGTVYDKVSSFLRASGVLKEPEAASDNSNGSNQ